MAANGHPYAVTVLTGAIIGLLILSSRSPVETVTALLVVAYTVTLAEARARR